VRVAKRFTLEISVGSAEAAQAAERGGADRIELCADLSVGGLTPAPELLRTTRQQISLPIFAMIRPRSGDFVYSASEFSSMCSAIEATKRHGANGVVLGILKKDGQVDVPRTRELVNLAQPLPVTFHRAFDESAELYASVEDVTQTGATRILTSGGAATAPKGVAALTKLVSLAGDRVIIVPGSGLNASNIAEVAQQTRAREFHSGLGTCFSYGSQDHLAFENEIREMATILGAQA
jgi:copper homeostasis protein